MKKRLLEILDSLEDFTYYTANSAYGYRLVQEAIGLVEQLPDDDEAPGPDEPGASGT